MVQQEKPFISSIYKELPVAKSPCATLKGSTNGNGRKKGGDAGRKAICSSGLAQFSEESLSLVSKAQPEIRTVSGAPGLRFSSCKEGLCIILPLSFFKIFLPPLGLTQLHCFHPADSFNFHLSLSWARGLTICMGIAVLV